MADVIKYRFVVRRGLASAWTTKNEVLLQGEFGLETDTGKRKMGDGVTAWNDLEYDLRPATRSEEGLLTAADKVKLDAVSGDGSKTQVGATLTRTGSSTATATSATTASKSITFGTPFDTLKVVHIEPGIGSCNASGDFPNHYVSAKSADGFTVTFKAPNAITTDIPFDWTASGVVTGSGIAALAGTFKRVRIGVAYSSDLTASGGDGTYLLYGGTGVVSGSLPAGLSLSVVAPNLLRLSGTCTEPSPATFATVVGVVTGDGQTATASQSISVLGPFTPAELFASGERGIWVDIQDLSTMFQDTAGTVPVTAAGQKVARINDKSGNGNHLTQATAANQPYLRNDGTNYYLELVGSTPTYLVAPNTNNMAWRTDSIMMGAATQYSSPSTNQSILSRSLYGPGAARWNISQATNSAYINYNNTSGNVASPNAPNGSATSVVSGYIDRAAGSGLVRVNAVAGTAASFTPDASTDLTTNYRLMLGVYNNSGDTGPQTGTGVTGRLYGLVVRFAAVDTDAMSDLEKWLGGKCGVTIP